MTTLGLKNVNLLSKEQYDGIAEPAKDELYAVDVDSDKQYKEMSVGWATPDFTAGIEQVEDVEYVAPCAGVLYVRAHDSNTKSYITINGNKFLIHYVGSNMASSCTTPFMIDKGTTYMVEFGRAIADQYITFYPSKGVI